MLLNNSSDVFNTDLCNDTGCSVSFLLAFYHFYFAFRKLLLNSLPYQQQSMFMKGDIYTSANLKIQIPRKRGDI